MKILKLQYILILAVLTACQDESFQVPMEENEVHIATENEILLKRGYLRLSHLRLFWRA